MRSAVVHAAAEIMVNNSTYQLGRGGHHTTLLSTPTTQFGSMMEKLFAVANEDDVPFNSKTLFASHFYRIILVAYGLLIYSL